MNTGWAAPATVLAACISAVAALAAAYLTYQIGTRTLEQQRAMNMADFLTKTATMETPQIRGAMNRLCATRVFPKEDLDTLYNEMFGGPCPPLKPMKALQTK